MSSDEYQTPDLASVLRTLAAYAPPSTPTAPVIQSHTPIQTASALDTELEEGEYEPSEATMPSLPAPTAASNAPPKSLHRQPINSPQITDPATLTTWPAALRHVTKNVARNDAAMARIKKLIHVQHQHERAWWDGREALKKKQIDRIEGRKKVDDVLRAVGGKVAPAGPETSPEEDDAELLRYDKKVHRACVEMVNATTAELKALGVPFFGMRPELITKDNEDGTTLQENNLQEGSGAHTRSTIRQSELMQLQKRMLELLEDLCKE